MSKKSKSASKEKNRKKKKQEKAARRALYESYKLQGNNTKSKRSRMNAKRGKKVGIRMHTKCGNIGCQQCFPVDFKPFLNSKGHPVDMPHWMYRKWILTPKGEKYNEIHKVIKEARKAGFYERAEYLSNAGGWL